MSKRNSKVCWSAGLVRKYIIGLAFRSICGAKNDTDYFIYLVLWGLRDWKIPSEPIAHAWGAMELLPLTKHKKSALLRSLMDWTLSSEPVSLFLKATLHLAAAPGTLQPSVLQPQALSSPLWTLGICPHCLEAHLLLLWKEPFRWCPCSIAKRQEKTTKNPKQT